MGTLLFTFIYRWIKQFIPDTSMLKPYKGWGGAFGAPPYSFFCPSTLICDTITVKFFDFS